jgi:hypothetical protein
MRPCDSACTGGHVLFILVPIILWVIFASFVRRPGFWAKVFALIAGSDNRLSLSRLQALGWTFAIWGSWAAAMAIHTEIKPATPAEVAHADSLLKAYQIRLRDSQDQLLRTVDDTIRYASEVRTAVSDSVGAARAYTQADATSVNRLHDAETQVRLARGKLAGAHDQVTANQAAVRALQVQVDSAQVKAAALDWVKIPAGLLVLAGLSVGSGVLSSLIASGSGESKTVCVVTLRAPTMAELSARSLTGAVTDYLVLEGTDFGARGRVRVANVRKGIRASFAVGTVVATPVWEDKVIFARLPADPFNVLVVDSPNGKVAYEVTGAPPAYVLGTARSFYEFADLFRDDKNPDHFDLMKFQMFGWTLIAVATYCGIVWTSMSSDLRSLPVVDQSIVVLTGVSLAAYLGNKGVSAGGEAK